MPGARADVLSESSTSQMVKFHDLFHMFLIFTTFIFETFKVFFGVIHEPDLIIYKYLSSGETNFVPKSVSASRKLEQSPITLKVFPLGCLFVMFSWAWISSGMISARVKYKIIICLSEILNGFVGF